MLEILVSETTKFDVKNFQIWKFQIQNVLVANNLLDVVLGRDAGTTEAKKFKFKMDCTKAMVILSSTMHQKQVMEVMAYETSREIWDSLARIHEQKSEENKVILMQQYYASRIESGKRISEDE